ncbi:MAG: hypothetical protein ABSC60_16565 [Acidobacteriota bacterium]|jgi:hypothetical protein
MKTILSICLFLLLSLPAFSQDLTHWYGYARVSVAGGLTYHFGAEFVGNPNGSAIVNLTGEYESFYIPSFSNPSTTWEVGVPLLPPSHAYPPGNYPWSRYGIKITNSSYTAVIVPSDLSVQRALFSISNTRTVNARIGQGSPYSCTGAGAIFQKSIPVCQADGAIEIQ